MTLQEAIKRIVASGNEFYCKICTVDSVNEETRTVDCSPLDEGAPLLGVNLQANQEGDDGITIFPAVGSYVVVAFLSPAVAVVVLTDKADKITAKIGDITAEHTADGVIYNGGKLGGMIAIQKLTDKINALKDTLNDLISKYNSHIHTTTATVGTGAAGVIAKTTSAATAAAAFKKDDYEDPKVKH